MLKCTLVFVFVILCCCSFVVLAQDAYTGEIPPAQIGSSCADQTVFHWKTETKAPWTLAMLIPVPEGYSPDEWDGAQAYMESFHQATAQNSDLPTMSNALMALWQPSTARLYAEFERTVTLETRDLRCIAGLWQVDPSSQAAGSNTESSDWIGVYDEAVDATAVSATDVQTKIESKLNAVNAQPGADPRPHHSYTSSTN